MRANSVASELPLKLVSSSRLRRVAASRSSASERSSTARLRMWGTADFWVSRTYCSSAPAARMASGSSSTNHTERVRTRTTPPQMESARRRANAPLNPCDATTSSRCGMIARARSMTVPLTRGMSSH